MRKKIALAAYALFTLFSAAHAQDTTSVSKNKNTTDTEKGLFIAIGFHLQHTNKETFNLDGSRKYFEVGLRHLTFQRSGYHGTAFTHGPSIEFSPITNPIYGFKYGAMFGSMGALGLSAVYYTDFRKGSLKVQPEVGLGLGYFWVSAGYNIPTIRNKDFERLRQSKWQLSIAILPFKIKTIKQTQRSPSQ